MPDEKHDQDEKRATAKLTDFLTNPHGIDAKSKWRLDTQADLSSNALAKGVLYHRFTSLRFAMKDEDANKSMIDEFADGLSALSWGAHRKSREEAVIFGRGMKEEKPGLRIESLEAIQITPPEGEKKRKLI